DQLRRIRRLVARLGDHKSDIIADPADAILDQCRKARPIGGRTVTPHVPRGGRQVAPTRGLPIRTRYDGEHPGGGYRGGRVVERIRAFAWGERSTCPNAMRGNTMSST